MSITTEQAAAWFENRAKNSSMSGAREMFRLAAEALREKTERENPKPLTLDDLRQMDGEVVWLEVLDCKDLSVPVKSNWGEVWIYSCGNDVSFWRFGNECDIRPNNENYGKTWIAYRHKPHSNI